AWSTCWTHMSRDVIRDPVRSYYLDCSWRSLHRGHAPGLGGVTLPSSFQYQTGPGSHSFAVAARPTCYNLVRAKIGGCHGIARKSGSGYQLEDVWYDALRGGLGAADYEPVAEELTSGDVRVAFFGSRFRPEGTMDVLDPELTADDVQPGPE